jgi:hypothetical protein
MNTPHSLFPDHQSNHTFLLGGVVSLTEVTQIAYNITRPHLKKQCANFMVLLELICEKGFSVIIGKYKMLEEEIHKVFRDYKRVKEELLQSDEILTHIAQKPNSDYSVAS